jgi:hypothetical protein
MDSKTTVGPLVRESQRQALSIQVEDAKSKGANIPLILTIIFTIVQYLETPKDLHPYLMTQEYGHSQ